MTDSYFHPYGPVHVYPDAAGGWRFRIKGKNGEIIASSESYSRRADAFRGAETLVELIRGL